MNSIDPKAMVDFDDCLGGFIEDLENAKLEQPEFAARMSTADQINAGWIKAATEFCESPIEQMLLAHLIFMSNGYGGGSNNLYLGSGPFEMFAPDVRVRPQLPVGDYRLDFAVFSTGFNDRVFLLAVECDGHEWHERTKEQARRDRKRDRDLQGLGWQTMRFTRSEIWEDARACASEIGGVLGDFVESTMPTYMRDRFMESRQRRAGMVLPKIAARPKPMVSDGANGGQQGD